MRGDVFESCGTRDSRVAEQSNVCFRDDLMKAHRLDTSLWYSQCQDGAENKLSNVFWMRFVSIGVVGLPTCTGLRRRRRRSRKVCGLCAIYFVAIGVIGVGPCTAIDVAMHV